LKIKSRLVIQEIIKMNKSKDEGQLNELAFLFGMPPEVAREFRLLWDLFEPKSGLEPLF